MPRKSEEQLIEEKIRSFLGSSYDAYDKFMSESCSTYEQQTVLVKQINACRRKIKQLRERIWSKSSKRKPNDLSDLLERNSEHVLLMEKYQALKATKAALDASAGALVTPEMRAWQEENEREAVIKFKEQFGHDFRDVEIDEFEELPDLADDDPIHDAFKDIGLK